MLLYNNILGGLGLRAMFGSAFELRVNYWVEVSRRLTFPPRFLLIPMSRRLYLGSTCTLTQISLFSSLP